MICNYLHPGAGLDLLDSTSAWITTKKLMGEKAENKMTREEFLNIVRDKRVLFITPSDVEYIRNKQEIDILGNVAKSLDIISPANDHTVKPTGVVRILLINLKVIFRNIKNYDLVFVAGVPQLIVPFTHFLFRKKILIIDFFVSIYDTIVADRQLLSRKNPAAGILKWLDRKTLSRADCVVVDTHEHAGYFSRMFDVDARKMAVVYLEADKSVYYPRHVQRPDNLKDKSIVFFFGAMNPLQGVDVILNTARYLETHKHILFVIVGPYDKIDNLEQYSNLSNVRFAARWLPQNEIADYVAMSDVCLAGHFSADIPKASRVIPGKAYSYLAMDKPVILGDNPANRELFSESTRNVHFVKMGDPEALADVILGITGTRSGGKRNAR